MITNCPRNDFAAKRIAEINGVGQSAIHLRRDPLTTGSGPQTHSLPSKKLYSFSFASSTIVCASSCSCCSILMRKVISAC